MRLVNCERIILRRPEEEHAPGRHDLSLDPLRAERRLRGRRDLVPLEPVRTIVYVRETKVLRELVDVW